MYDVITVGSATVDVFAHTEFPEMVHDKKHKECIAYPVGTKILVKKLDISIGGGGTNTAVSFSRLGHKVAYLGKIGKKENSTRILDNLKKEKIDTSLVVRCPGDRTGYSIILDSIKHDRTILTYKGSNNDLLFKEIKKNKLKTKWFYFATMMGRSFKTQEKLAAYAKKNNIKIAFNTSSYLAKKGIHYNKKILAAATFLVLNKEEASYLSGKKTLRQQIKKLHEAGPKIIAITDGGRTLQVYADGFIYSADPHPIRIVETTGAGDAFASSFLSGLIKKNDVEFAIKLGMTNAQSVIQHHGSKEKLLTYKESLAILKKKPVKITKKKLN